MHAPRKATQRYVSRRDNCSNMEKVEMDIGHQGSLWRAHINIMSPSDPNPSKHYLLQRNLFLRSGRADWANISSIPSGGCPYIRRCNQVVAASNQQRQLPPVRPWSASAMVTSQKSSSWLLAVLTIYCPVCCQLP